MKRFGWLIPLLMVLGGGAGLMLAVLVTYVMPKRYESSAVLQVRTAAVFEEGVVAGEVTRVTPAIFVATESELIRSAGVLKVVADELDLENRWNLNSQQVRGKLLDMIEVDVIRGTELIRIEVRASNPRDTRDVAAGVSRVYRVRRAEEQNERIARDLTKLNEAVEAQEKVVEEKRRALTTLIRPLKRNDHPGGGDRGDDSEKLDLSIGQNGGPMSDESQTFDSARKEFEEAQSLLEDLKIKQIGEQMQRRISEDPVIVHEEPVENEIPVSPKVAMNLVLGTFAGMIAGLVLGLGLAAVLGRRSEAA